MLKLIFANRRVWLLGLLLGLVLVVTRWTFSIDQGGRLLGHGGYWLILILVGLFFRALVPVIRQRWRGAEFGRFELGVVAGIVLIIGVWTSHDKPGYKILADELLLLGTSMGMHYDREAAYPIRATDVQGMFQILNSNLDKRPLLFPFLAATVHDLTGYRPENPFYLNMGLAGVFLGLVYLLGWNIGNSRWSGILGMLLFAGLPLLAQQASGGGFELLNLVLIATFALLLACFLEEPDGEGRLEAFIFGTLLLASTRYESVIFLAFAGVAVLVGWSRAGRVNLSWPLIISPVFLMPILIQNRMFFTGNSTAWEMASLPGTTEPFGFQYFAPNLGHALEFFFDFSGYQPSSALFAALGLLAMPFFALWIVRIVRQAGRSNPAELAWAIAGTSLFAVTAVYLFYFWGQFDHPLIRRLSLPLHLLMMVAIILIGSRIFRSAKGWQIAALVVLGGIFFQSIPVMAKQGYRTSYSPDVAMQIRADFLSRQTDRNILFIDNDSLFWITHKIPASPVKQAQFRKEGFAYHMRNHSFQDIYVFQSIRTDDKTGARGVDPEDDLGADFVLEPVFERRLQTLHFARISRLTSIKDHDEVLARASSFVVPLNERLTIEQMEKNRAIYLENWIKQLP